MRLAVFLVSFFCFLFNSNASALAASYGHTMSIGVHGTHAHLPQKSEKKHRRHYLNTNPNHSIFEGISQSSREECLDNDENNEEDEDHSQTLLVAKQLMLQQLAWYAYTASMPDADVSCNYLRDSAFFFGQQSHKYLVLGVLRI